MHDLGALIAVFEEARGLLAAPDNNFLWSSWEDADDALREIDAILTPLRSAALPSDLQMRVLFAPTGPIQEVSLSSGWGDEFLQLADRFDAALIGVFDDHERPYIAVEPCRCLSEPPVNLTTVVSLGLDGNFADVSVEVCGDCGRDWLRYFHEAESFTGSGRWYLGAITPEQRRGLTAGRARDILEGLDWYYYGGSYYQGGGGRTSGKIVLAP